MEEKVYRMKHFIPGKHVVYNGDAYIVDYITVRGFDLYIHLVGRREAVHSKEVHCEPTVFLLERQ